MSITVMIEVEDSGAVTVGTPPEEGGAAQAGAQSPMGADGMMAAAAGQSGGEETADKSFMRPAKSVDDALQTARDLLTNPQAEQAAKQKGFESVDQGQGMPGAMGGMGG